MLPHCKQRSTCNWKKNAGKNGENRMRVSNSFSARYSTFTCTHTCFTKRSPTINRDGEGVYALSIIAFFILAIAWINYVNLATARSLNRANEVGCAKSDGSIPESIDLPVSYGINHHECDQLHACADHCKDCRGSRSPNYPDGIFHSVTSTVENSG